MVCSSFWILQISYGNNNSYARDWTLNRILVPMHFFLCPLYCEEINLANRNLKKMQRRKSMLAIKRQAETVT